MSRACLIALLGSVAGCATSPLPIALAPPPGAAGAPALSARGGQVIVAWPGASPVATVVNADGSSFAVAAVTCEEAPGLRGEQACPAPPAAAQLAGDGWLDLRGLWPPRWEREGRMVVVGRASEGCVVAAGDAVAGLIDGAWVVPGACSEPRRVEVDARGALVAAGDVAVAMDAQGALWSAWQLSGANRRLARLGDGFVVLAPRAGGWQLAQAPPGQRGLAVPYRPTQVRPAWLRAGAVLHFGRTAGGGDVTHLSVQVDAIGPTGLAYAWAGDHGAGVSVVDAVALAGGDVPAGPLAGWPLVLPRGVWRALQEDGRAVWPGGELVREGLALGALSVSTGGAAAEEVTVPLLRARRVADGARIWIAARSGWPVVVKVSAEGALVYLAAVTVDASRQGARKDAPDSSAPGGQQ